MNKYLLIFAVSLLMPHVALAGSQTFTSSGTFTVPAYETLTVEVWGGGGGGGGAGWQAVDDAEPGGDSTFGSPTPVVGDGGSRGLDRNSGGAGGAGGGYSGGDSGANGADGDDRCCSYSGAGGNGGGADGGAGGASVGAGKVQGPPGSAPGGGGAGGSQVFSNDGGGGGGGGYASKTFNTGELAVGSEITVTVGAGGAQGHGGPYGEIHGGDGARGEVRVTWTEPVLSCTTSVSPSSVLAGNSATLSWSSTNATAVYVENIGWVATSSSTLVAPASDTDYACYAYNADTGETSAWMSDITLDVQLSCSWSGGSITHGDFVTAYQSSVVPYGASCVSEVRTCSDGALSGSYQYTSCSSAGAPSCTLDGVTVANGDSYTFYSQETSTGGVSCSTYAQERTCSNGLFADQQRVVVTFNTSDTWTVPAGVTEVEVLVVGGGGAGHNGDNAHTGAGGGGGGGVSYDDAIAVTPGEQIAVTVGVGAYPPQPGASSFGSYLSAEPGGWGGIGNYNNNNPGGDGASGGGGARGGAGGSGIPGQGHDGGDGVSVGAGGGGGGAGEAGANGSNNVGGKGGDGFLSSITGTPVYYGGGGGGGGAGCESGGAGGVGGGGAGGTCTNGVHGTDGLGGGGGGGGGGSGTAKGGGYGGDGVVIVAYDPPEDYSAYQYASCGCTAAYTCSGETIQYTNTSCEISDVSTCVSPGFCSAGSSSCLYPPPAFSTTGERTGHLEVIPLLVHYGDTTQVHWDVENVDSCTVTGANGDTWNAAASGAGGRVTSSITKRTTYTLSCGGLDGSQVDETETVQIIPVFREQ